MPHSQHGKDSPAKQKHRRAGSHVSRAKQERSKQPAEDAVKIQPLNPPATSNIQPPAEQSRPWSPWIPDGDGRWFYQGRLKPDGSGWEYQFTAGYPPAPRRRDPNLHKSCPAVTQSSPYSQQAAVPAAATGMSTPTTHRHHVKSGGDDTEGGGNDEGEEGDGGRHTQQAPVPSPNFIPAKQLQAAKTAPRNPAVPQSGSGGGGQAVAKHAGGKKLSAIVKADKERRISSRRRIKSWLSEVTP